MIDSRIYIYKKNRKEREIDLYLKKKDTFVVV